MLKRQIDPQMVEWLDGKLSGNGLAELALRTKDARLLFGLAAESCVGIKESGGNNQGPLVRLIQETIGRAEGEPWCASFVQTCLAYAEFKTAAISPVSTTEHVQTMWRDTPELFRVKMMPLKYAIVCWKYEGSSLGHTGIVIEHGAPKWMRTVEGNSNVAGSRDGDGVGYHRRDWVRNGSLVKLGFLKPF